MGIHLWLCNVGICSLPCSRLSGSSRRSHYLELGVFLSQMVLHMQQVLDCELTEAEDAQEVEVCQVACVLPIQVTKSYNADYPLQHVQVCVLNLQAIKTQSYAMTVCYTLRMCSSQSGLCMAVLHAVQYLTACLQQHSVIHALQVVKMGPGTGECRYPMGPEQAL